jgi:NAD(P)-dependent dehydrogenase (short-subunit alcohol dehydrogenase family)
MARTSPGAGSGSVAFVTGGGSGIGRAAARLLATRGASVAIFDIAAPSAEQVVGEIRDEGGTAIAIVGDTSSEADVSAALDRSAAELGDCDIVVTAAAILNDVAGVDAIPAEEFDQVIAVNLRGPFLVMRHAVPQMRRVGHGVIVCIASVDGYFGEIGLSAYCASKGGVINLVRAAALDLAREGIRVNAVCPSVTDTPLLQKRIASLPNRVEILAERAERHPLGRLLQPEDTAGAIGWLVSPDAAGVTGAIVPVDAGLSAGWEAYHTPVWLAR